MRKDMDKKKEQRKIEKILYIMQTAPKEIPKHIVTINILANNIGLLNRRIENQKMNT